MTRPIPYNTIQSWKSHIRSNPDPFILSIPKIELHVHIEGTLTPSLRFSLAARNNLPLTSVRLNKTFHTLPELESAYNLLEPISIKGSGVSAFFDAYYGGMDCLRTERDFYDLAWSYFERARGMNVRYCEVFVDLQAHTRRGVGVESVLRGLGRAREDAWERLNLKANYILSFLRDLSPDSAMEHYELALPYREMFVGIGLDSNEYDRPPLLFKELYARARADGFKLTAHCDVTQKNTHEHIRQVVEELGGTGAERVDHGLDAAEKGELVERIREKGAGMTLCPWAYVRHHTEANLFSHMRTLMDAGIRICISSDSPAYVESNWVTDNLALLKLRGGFTDEDVMRVQRDALDMCWADQETKGRLRGEIEDFVEDWRREGKGEGV
ncbi:adenine deaminase/adenosine deaminase [Cadophora sp. DSE1049]|nr:adenine deaminase/adenosine deaminase [Cadophora sp. DSE1049]